METIINLPKTSFVSHDIKWFEFRPQIASAHAQRVWIEFDQIAHALLCSIWDDEKKTCYFQRGQWSALLSFARGGRCCVLYTRQCYNTLWQWVPVSESLGVILSSSGEPVLSWQVIINSSFFVEAGFLI